MQFSCMATGWFLHQPMHEQSKNHISLIKQAYMQDHFNGVVMCITSSYTLPFWGENCSLATILCKEPKVHGASSCPLRQLFAGTWPIDRFPDRAMYVCIPKSIYNLIRVLTCFTQEFPGTIRLPSISEEAFKTVSREYENMLKCSSQDGRVTDSVKLGSYIFHLV